MLLLCILRTTPFREGDEKNTKGPPKEDQRKTEGHLCSVDVRGYISHGAKGIMNPVKWDKEAIEKGK